MAKISADLPSQRAVASDLMVRTAYVDCVIAGHLLTTAEVTTSVGLAPDEAALNQRLKDQEDWLNQMY